MNWEMLRDMVAARRNLFAFLVFLALLNLGLMLYLSLWQRPELAKAQDEWLAQREAQARGERGGDSGRYDQGNRDLALFRKRLIPKQEFAAFLDDMFDTARSNSLTVKGVTYKPTRIKDQDIVAYGIAYTVTGRYASIKSYIADLVRHPDLVTLDSVSLVSKSPTEESIDLKVNLTAYLKTEGA